MKKRQPKKWSDLEKIWITYEGPRGYPYGCYYREVINSVEWIRADVVEKMLQQERERK